MKSNENKSVRTEEPANAELSLNELEGVAGGRGGRHEPPHAARADASELGEDAAGKALGVMR